MYCANCGTQLEEGALVCFNCGIPTEVETTKKQANVLPKVNYGAEFDKFKNIATESAGKAVDGAKQIANQAAQKYSFYNLTKELLHIIEKGEVS